MGVTITLESKIFNKEERELIIGAVPFRAAKFHKAATVDKMVAGPHTGEIYNKGRGSGFQRLHQASARGQRPAPDTTNLINSIESQKVDTYHYEVIVEPNPYVTGQNAEIVAEMLQSYHGRPIQTKSDAEEALVKQREYAVEAIQQLV